MRSKAIFGAWIVLVATVNAFSSSDSLCATTTMMSLSIPRVMKRGCREVWGE